LRRATWGKGYATKGSQALIDKAFSEQLPTAVVSCGLVGNVASIRVMKKVGMRRIGLFSLPGFEMPCVKYALSHAEWQTKTACGLAPEGR
jgi:RimJ/RimL family protein N-acetyltransferase